MAIKVACPSCGKVLTAPNEWAGRTGKCPECRSEIPITSSSIEPAKTQSTPTKSNANAGYSLSRYRPVILMTMGFLLVILLGVLIVRFLPNDKAQEISSSVQTELADKATSTEVVESSAQRIGSAASKPNGARNTQSSEDSKEHGIPKAPTKTTPANKVVIRKTQVWDLQQQLANAGFHEPLKRPEPVKSIDLQSEDLRAFMSDTGGWANQDAYRQQLEDYVKFGSKQDAKRAKSGDEFDRIEIAKQNEVRKRESGSFGPFLIRDIDISTCSTERVEEDGTMFLCTLPLRIRKASNIYTKYSGCLSRLNLSFLNSNNLAFLTKTKTLQPISWLEANAVRNNDGFLYIAEETSSTTCAFVVRDIEVAKSIARRPGDFTAQIVISDLAYQKVYEWGYLQEKAVLDKHWDCEAVTNAFRTTVPEIPWYFQPQRKSQDIPTALSADLLWAGIVDQSGATIGSGSFHDTNIELVMPSVIGMPKLIAPNDADTARPSESTSSSKGKRQNANVSLPMPNAKTQTPSPPNKPQEIESVFTDTWLSPAGGVYRISDNGVTVAIELTSDDPILESLEGTLVRTGEKWMGTDVLKGNLHVGYKKDPLSTSKEKNVRQLVVKRAFLADKSTFRVLCEKIFWDKQGKEVRREQDAVEFIRKQ